MARPWREIGRYGSVGIEFVLTILIVSWFGHWIDGRFSLHGWGLGAGFLLGVAVAFRNLVRTAQEMQRDIERAEANDPGASRWTVDERWIHPEPDESPSRDGSLTSPEPPPEPPPSPPAKRDGRN